MNAERIGSFDLLISYYQIALLDARMPSPFNEWRREHVQQGFTWRPGSVSFGTLDITPAHVDVWLGAVVAEVLGVRRAIRVPFSVAQHADLRVAVVGCEEPITVPAGDYALTFQHGLHPSGESQWCVFTFVRAEGAMPAILVTDADLRPICPLLMEADPA